MGAGGPLDVVRSIADDPWGGAILVTGAGPRFCGGRDLKAMLCAPGPRAITSAGWRRNSTRRSGWLSSRHL